MPPSKHNRISERLTLTYDDLMAAERILRAVESDHELRGSNPGRYRSALLGAKTRVEAIRVWLDNERSSDKSDDQLRRKAE